MRALAALAVLLGLDNLRVTIGLGLTGLGTSARRRLAVGFGLAETLAVLAGFALGSRAVFEVGPLSDTVILIAAALALAGALLGTRTKRWLDRPWIAFALPAALALDNVAAGVGIAASRQAVLVAVTIGCTSATWSFLGLWLGMRLSRHRPVATLAASGLLSAALFALLS